MNFKLSVINLVLLFFASSPGLAKNLVIEDTSEFVKSPTRSELHTDLENTYSKLLNWLQIKTLPCPIKIIFKPLSGFHGFTPNSSRECNNLLYLDSGLMESVQIRVTMVHELIHIFRNQYNSHEEYWLNEGLAQLIESEFIGIWPQDKFDALNKLNYIFLSDKDIDFQPQGKGYAPAYFFMKYLYNRFGGLRLLRELITSPHSGWDNIESALIKLKQEKIISIPIEYLNRKSIWSHFALAILLNHPAYANYGLFLLDYNFQDIKLKPTSLLPVNQLTFTNENTYPWMIRFTSLNRGKIESENHLLEQLFIKQPLNERILRVSMSESKRPLITQPMNKSSFESGSFIKDYLIIINSESSANSSQITEAPQNGI